MDDLCQNEQQSHKLEDCLKNYESNKQMIDQCDNEFRKRIKKIL